LGNWTGHASRLNRDHLGSFGSKSYAREELVAEMAGAFVCASLGMVPTIRHADYIGSWLEVLREDNRAIRLAVPITSQPSFISSPSALSRSATMLAVRNSILSSSGNRCRSRRVLTARAAIASSTEERLSDM
jgi:hypothetical protein